MGVSFRQKGDFSKLTSFLEKAKEAVKNVSERLGIPKNAVYDLYLKSKED